MPHQKKRSSTSIMAALGIPARDFRWGFGTGEVAEILGVPMWRLHKFLSPQYQLSSTEQLGGKGHGSRRVFTVDDVYRIAIAGRLNGDGFAPKFIGEIMSHLKEHELIDRDNQGEEVVMGITFTRGKKGVQPRVLPSGSPELKVAGDTYYALDFMDIIDEINARIAKLRERG